MVGQQIRVHFQGLRIRMKNAINHLPELFRVFSMTRLSDKTNRLLLNLCISVRFLSSGLLSGSNMASPYKAP